MPTSTNITTSYAGESAGKYIAAALLSGTTIENGGITVKPNVKYKEVIKKLDTGSLTADGSCDFAPSSSITLSEVILQPKELQVNLQLCKKDFRSDWDAISMGYSAFDSLPPSFQEFLIAQVAAKVAEKTEQDVWNGIGTNNGSFGGVLESTTGMIIPSTAAFISVDASNVIDYLGLAVDNIPDSVYGKEDLSLYVSQKIARLYVRALGGFGAAGLGANGTNAMGTQWFNNGSLSFDGVKIFVANGLTGEQVVAAQKSNLVFGTGLLSDHNEVKVIDLADIDGSQNVNVIMRYTAGTAVAIPSEVVYVNI